MKAALKPAALIAASALAGCAITPRVEYHAMSAGPPHDSWVLFRLTDSVIVVGAPPREPADGKVAAAPVSLGFSHVDCTAEGCGALAVAVAPSDFEDALYALEPRSKNFIETRITPTYQTSSLRLKVLSVEAKDHRMEAIDTVGAIASGVSKLAARSSADTTEEVETPKPKGPRLTLPFTIDLAEARCESEAGAGCVSAVVRDPASTVHGAPQPLPDNPGWSYALQFLDDPKREGLIPRAEIASVHGAMVESVCRPVMLDLSPNSAGQPVVASLRVLVADPDWLETAPFPTKGAMSFQPLCGIDVQAEAVTTVGVDALTTAFFNNVAAVRAAQRK